MITRRDPYGLVWVGTFSVLWLMLIVGLNLVGGALLVGYMLITGGVEGLGQMEPLIGEGMAGLLPDWFFAAVLSVQMPSMLALTLAVGWGYRAWQRRRAEEVEPWVGLLALRPASTLAYAVAVLVGFTVGWLPGWFAGWLRDLLPWLDAGALEMIEQALLSGAPALRGLTAFWIVAGAGVLEELVFRGLLWRLMARSAGPVAVWIGTSLLFAVYHMDPVQSLALIPTALALGWIRLRTGSLLPCIVVHMINNGLGVAFVWLGVVEGPTLWMCVLAFFVACAALMLTPRPPQP